ncbi:hypothetical protein KAU39_05175, partial [bacterium]|nr:hypothetical protein [bacterium]
MEDNNNKNSNNEEIEVFYKPSPKNNANAKEDIIPVENQLKKIVDYLEGKLVEETDKNIETQGKTPEDKIKESSEAKEILTEKRREEKIQQILEPKAPEKGESFNSHIQQIKDALESILPIDEKPIENKPPDKSSMDKQQSPGKQEDDIEQTPEENFTPGQIADKQDSPELIPEKEPAEDRFSLQQVLNKQVDDIEQTPE